MEFTIKWAGIYLGTYDKMAFTYPQIFLLPRTPSSMFLIYKGIWVPTPKKLNQTTYLWLMMAVSW